MMKNPIQKGVAVILRPCCALFCVTGGLRLDDKGIHGKPVVLQTFYLVHLCDVNTFHFFCMVILNLCSFYTVICHDKCFICRSVRGWHSW